MSWVRDHIKDSVFGAQDGLVSTLGALTGIAEGSGQRDAVLLAGLVIVTVESLSMAAGSYLSSKSQREYMEKLVREEEKSIERDPDGERREIWEMYRRRGYSDEEISLIEKRLFSDKKLLLEDMAHKELGICPAAMEKPSGNALSMGLAYIAGGSVPVLPYCFLPVREGMAVSLAATLAALFALGGWKGRLVDRVWWRSGFEMVFIAGLAALAGYLIGHLLG